MSTYLGKKVLVTHLALVLTNFITHLNAFFLSALTWKEIVTFFVFIFPECVVFSSLIGDYGILGIYNKEALQEYTLSLYGANIGKYNKVKVPSQVSSVTVILCV